MIERLTLAEFEEVDFEIADTETRRSATHHRNVRGWPDLGFEGASPDDMEAMWERVMLGEMATDMFLDNPAARTATLGIVRLRGDWRRDAQTQATLVGPDTRLRTEYSTRVFERTDADNKLHHAIDAGIVSMRGIAMLTRQRRLLLTDNFEQQFVHASGNLVMARVAIAVSKLSTFAVDLETLRDYPTAAREIQEILLAGMVLQSHERRLRRIANVMGLEHDDDQEDRLEEIELMVPNVAEERAAMEDASRLLEKMREYSIGPDAVLGRVAAGNALSVRTPDAVAALEQAIVDQTGLLIPTTTTFYGKRVVKSLSR